jgi:DNA-binding MarR family transcriptional regulator|tara:strand:+ start:5233 stop:5544 length:312 start_codon:yes stop_codon:yes gene_type:complete
MADRYPKSPGAKGPDGTSQDAAEAVAPTVSYLRRIAMHSINRLSEATPLEAVAISGVTRESLQPRFSELRAMGLIEPTGARRRNPSGKSASVLRLTDKGRAAL